MSRPRPDDAKGMQSLILRRIGSLERRGRGRPTRGPAAFRDEVLGVPTTAEERAALAGTEWLDSDLGLTFRYYAEEGDGAAPGVTAGPAAGWYPADPRMPYVLCEKNLSQSLGSAGTAVITWRSDSGNYDAFDMFDGAGSSTDFVVPWTGLWRVKAKVRISTAVALTGVVRRNGSDYNRSRASDIGGTGAPSTLRFNDAVYAVAGSTLSIAVTAAAAVTFVATNAESTMELMYEGPPPT